MTVNDERNQHEDDDAIEISVLGANLRIPKAWTVSVGPYIKWSIIGFSAGMFFIMVCYGLKLVLK